MNVTGEAVPGGLRRAQGALSAMVQAEAALSALRERLKRGDVILQETKGNDRPLKAIGDFMAQLDRWAGKLAADVETWRAHERRAAP